MSCMKRVNGSRTINFLLVSMLLLAGCKSQPTTPGATVATPASLPAMILTASIPLDGVKGRLDHFAASKGKVYVSALGNNSVEVIDLFAGAVSHTIADVPNPQGIAFSPEANELFVASAEGKVYIYRGDTYKLVSTLTFEGGADNMRYDSETRRVYVGCGDDEKTGAIATIDAMTNLRSDEVYKLGGEPESFQLERQGRNIYVNVPDMKQIVVINRKTRELTRWPVGVGQNFPMALDEADHRVIVGRREPASIAVFDTTNGKMVASVPTVQDTDDLYYSAEDKRVYVPGREGAIWVYHQDDPDHYALISKIATALGAGTAGYFGRTGKGFDRFYVGVPAGANTGAEVRIYTIQK
jgi:DNA-binding beta-propeller fold protein YncE